MAKEIERKFLVADDSYLSEALYETEISQGYLSVDPDRVVRIRVAGPKGLLTVKTRTEGISRHEWEFEIPACEAREMIEKAAIGVISKTRYFVAAEDNLMWEVDIFHGEHEGMKVAEIELPSEDTEFTKPSFVGKEVTGDPGYYNSNLIKGRKKVGHDKG